MSRFIVIEGIDGSGKTTLAKGISKTLSEQGMKQYLLANLEVHREQKK